MMEAVVYDSQTLGKVRDSLYNTLLDLQFSPMMKMVCLHANGNSFLYVLTHNIAVSQEQLRQYLLRLMQVLAGHDPDDVSISGWAEILSLQTTPSKPPREEAPVLPLGGVRGKAEMCVYSENEGPKMVFVHTANTGSDAYYQLAAPISDTVSFAAIEPYTLYHPDDERHTIQAMAST